MSLDSDEAGGAAAERTYDQMIGEAQQMGLTLRVVLMPTGDDPADTVVKAGPEGFRSLVEKAVPLLEFVLRREADRYVVGDADDRDRVLRKGLTLLAKTQSGVIRREAARLFSGWIKVEESRSFATDHSALR